MAVSLSEESRQTGGAFILPTAGVAMRAGGGGDPSFSGELTSCISGELTVETMVVTVTEL